MMQKLRLGKKMTTKRWAMLNKSLPFACPTRIHSHLGKRQKSRLAKSFPGSERMQFMLSHFKLLPFAK
jgi:hypothetical protein